MSFLVSGTLKPNRGEPQVAESRRYTSPPLSLVTAEIRLMHEPRLEDSGALNRFIEPLRQKFPLISTEQIQLAVAVRDVSPNEGGIAPRTFDQIRGTDVDRTRMISLQPRSLTFSTKGKDYQGFKLSVEPFIRASVESLLSVAPQAMLDDIGLRYLNEIEMPSLDSGPDDWRRWIRGDVLSASAASTGVCLGFRSSSHSHEETETDLFAITFTCGNHRGTSVIRDTSPLAPPTTSRRQAIVIDIEGNWSPDKACALGFVDTIPYFDRLHCLADEPFDWVLTDYARDQFGGRPRA